MGHDKFIYTIIVCPDANITVMEYDPSIIEPVTNIIDRENDTAGPELTIIVRENDPVGPEPSIIVRENDTVGPKIKLTLIAQSLVL